MLHLRTLLIIAAVLLTLAPNLASGPAYAASPAAVLVDHELEAEALPSESTEALSAPSEVPAPEFVALSPPYSAATPLPAKGRAMYYNPGVMGQVLMYRLKNGQIELCDGCVGYAALLRAGDLNRRIWLEWEDGSVDGPFLVIDVAARHHIPSLLERDWVVDLDYHSAQRRGMNRPLPVTVLAAPPVVPDQPNVAATAKETAPAGEELARHYASFACSRVYLHC